jgi:hypothetical protein
MKTTDLFKSNRSAKRLNESLEKTFGTKINFQDFDTPKLEDARNKLRTQIHDARSQSGFNETIENETLTKAQWMHDAIVSELAEREEYIVDTTTDENYESMWADADIEEGSGIDRKELMDILKRFDENMNEIGGYGDPDFDKILAALNQGDVESAVEEVYGNYSDQDGGELRDMDDYIEDLEYEFKDLAGVSDDEGGETDDGYALASAGFGSDEDYESIEMERDRDPEDWDEGNSEPPNNFAVSINGKQWKVFKGRGRYADDSAEREHYYQLKDWAAKKSEATGKKWTVSVTGEPATESIEEKAPPGAKAERMVKHIKAGYADDGKLTKKEKGIAYATAWKQHNKEKNEDMNTNEAYINSAKDAIDILADIRQQSKLASRGESDPVRPNQLVNDLWDVMQWIEANMQESIETESVTTGEDMARLQEGEIQQASAIVTAKTMVDRVGRWIEELSGMENDTLLQLGDSIRDEMGQEQSKAFIQAVAPAIQQALETLKGTRDTLSTGVRSLASGEQPADMLGAEPTDMGGDEMAAEPDAMNMGDEMGGEDEFAAAEPAAGLGDAGREQRESINRSSSLLKVLAG